MSENSERSLWGSRTGFLLAAIGSAVGLGNIWRFSYKAYENGGGAFLVPYLVALVVAGIPLMIVEYTLGHKTKGSTPLAFAKVHKKFEVVGWWLPLVATLGILFFYSVVIGWCCNYFVFSFDLSWDATNEAGKAMTTGEYFGAFLNGSDGASSLGLLNLKVIISTAIVWFLCWIICYRDVNHGIEKACLFFMPLLLVLTTILVIAACSLEGAGEGIKQYLNPQWHKINVFNNPEAWGVWTSAFGQIFFTLSLGFGIMITYASYLPKKTDIVGNALLTCIANCAYSIFAGFAVFGVLGFMAGQQGVAVSEVAKGGGGLAFIAYPAAISQLPFSDFFKGLFGATFFLALVVAGLSSAISLIEAFVCAITDKFQIKRGGVVTFICIAGFLGSMIYATGAGDPIMTIVNTYTDYALLIAGLVECLLVAWVLKASKARQHVNETGGIHLPVIWEYLVKYITPVILFIILFIGLKNQISEYGKENFPYTPHIIYGLRTIGITLLFAWGLTMFKWYRKSEHKPEDEHILT